MRASGDTRRGVTDWNRVEGLSDQDIDAAIALDPDTWIDTSTTKAESR